MQYPELRALRAATAALLLLLAVPVLTTAQTPGGQFGLVRWPGGDMYATASFSAAQTGSVPRGEKVEFLERDGTWWRVRYQGKEGWMSRIGIEPITTAAAPAASAAPAPSPAPTPAAAAPVAAATPAAAPAPATPSIFAALQALVAPAAVEPPITNRGHAVVFGVSKYAPNSGIKDLKGVPRDMDSASAMAQLMGISQDRVTIYRDQQVSKAAMSATLVQLAKDIQPDEPVLIYYSGHGGRTQDPSVPGRCLEGLITYDQALFSSSEMAELLRPIAKLTDNLFVFFDACHSGGLTATRAVGGQQRFTPKFVARADASNCSEVANMLRPPAGATRAVGNRYIYAAAARFNEVSLDDEQNGGLATSSFLRCMAVGRGRSQTVEELRACAQEGINATLAGNTQFKPHNMTITGDLSYRPVRADLSAAFKEQLMNSAAQGTLSNRPAASKSAAISSALVTQGWPDVYNPKQAFDAISARTDRSLPLVVEAPATLQIDKEALQVKVQAPADGYVYVFQATGDDKNAVMLFPNTSDRDNRVKAGQSLALPRASWPLVAGGPEGDNRLMVVFSKTERDIGQLVGQEAGPFLDLAVSPIGMQALAMAVSRSASADDAECQGSNVAARPAYCAAGFSASVKTIRERR
ncbi:MAG: caspase family protein [Pseudomonadota bacterium]